MIRAFVGLSVVLVLVLVGFQRCAKPELKTKSPVTIILHTPSPLDLSDAKARELLALTLLKLRAFGSIKGPLKMRIKAPQFLKPQPRTVTLILQRQAGGWLQQPALAQFSKLIAAVSKAAGGGPVRSALAEIVPLPEGLQAKLPSRVWLSDKNRLALLAVDLPAAMEQPRWGRALPVIPGISVHRSGDPGEVQLTPVSVRHQAFNFRRSPSEEALWKTADGAWFVHLEGDVSAGQLAALALPEGWSVSK
ncbi:MAG: hypothetical protein OSB21_09375 [Myxococcota bacterium]|nr:hypothetical protein [Myxococcota bacterium]